MRTSVLVRVTTVVMTAGLLAGWPLPGAQQFGGITVAPDETLWLADGLANTIRHFIPPS